MSKRIKLYVPGGWSSVAREHMIETCMAYKLPFVDSGMVADRTMTKSGIDVIQHKEGSDLPESYIFFAHRDIEDLPYNVLLSKAS